MTTTYTTSEGEVKQIADLAYPYLKSALAKLEREQPDRIAEIEAMRLEVAKRDIDEEANPRAAIGGNMPPPDPAPPAQPVAAAVTFEALKAHVADLREEAKHWLDGAPVKTQAEAETLGRLAGELVDGWKALDAARKVEAKPFDDGKKEVQDRYNPILKGADDAVKLTKVSLGKWDAFVKAEAAKAAEAARKAAAEATEAAAKALRDAHAAANLEALDEAEYAVTAARQETKAAAKVEANAPVTKVGNRTLQTRTYYNAELGDFFEWLQFVTANYPDELEAFLTDLARKQVAGGNRHLPGIIITSEQRAA